MAGAAEGDWFASAAAIAGAAPSSLGGHCGIASLGGNLRLRERRRSRFAVLSTPSARCSATWCG
ncbi:hypothetical protein ACTMU2_26255 [Cupriavidus basilensis]